VERKRKEREQKGEKEPQHHTLFSDDRVHESHYKSYSKAIQRPGSFFFFKKKSH